MTLYPVRLTITMRLGILCLLVLEIIDLDRLGFCLFLSSKVNAAVERDIVDNIAE